MITNKMIEFLKKQKRKPDGSFVHDTKFCVYFPRIQRQINRALKNGKWLAEHCPELLLDEEREFTENSGRIRSNRRIKMLVEILLKAKPRMQLEFTLRRIIEEINEEESNLP